MADEMRVLGVNAGFFSTVHTFEVWDNLLSCTISICKIGIMSHIPEVSANINETEYI